MLFEPLMSKLWAFFSTLSSNKRLPNGLWFFHFNLLFSCNSLFPSKIESNFFPLDSHPLSQGKRGHDYHKFDNPSAPFLACIQSLLSCSTDPRKHNQIEKACKKDCQDNLCNWQPYVQFFAFILARCDYHHGPKIEQSRHNKGYQEDWFEHETCPMGLQIERSSSLEEENAETLSNQVRCGEEMHNFGDRF